MMMDRIDRTVETDTPMSPSTPYRFKCSFTVKYIGLLRQVFNPFTLRSKIYCNRYTSIGPHDFMSLEQGAAAWNGHPKFPSRCPFTPAFSLLKLSRFDLDVKYALQFPNLQSVALFSPVLKFSVHFSTF